MSATHTVVPFDFTASYASAVVPVGTVYKRVVSGHTRKYVFVYNAGADSIAAADVVPLYTTFTFGYVSVTDATDLELVDSTSTKQFVAGIAGAAAATTTYLWLWFAGYGTHSITTDGSAAAGNGIVCAQNAKVATASVTADDPMKFGTAMAADVSTTLSSTVLHGGGMFPWDA